MTTNLSLGTADIVVLCVLAVLILLAYLVVFTSIAFWFIYKKKNL